MLITVFLICAMLLVLYFDITRYIIPNWLCGLLLILYPIGVYMSAVPVDWQKGLMAMGIVFVVGYIIFSRNWMGGGDVKLLIVTSLWVGLAKLMDFMFFVAILGGVLSVALYIVRKLPLVVQRAQKMPRILRVGEPVPYGIAISIGFLLMMKMGNIADVAMP
ncbi:MAG: prepilin peptidase [Alphaproteobacteria bacterium]